MLYNMFKGRYSSFKFSHFNWPNTLLRHFMLGFPLIYHPSVNILLNKALPVCSALLVLVLRFTSDTKTSTAQMINF